MKPGAFLERSSFRPSQDYKLLPFRFGRLEGDRYVLTNDVGEYAVVPRPDLEAMVNRTLDLDGTTYKTLKSRHFLFDRESRVAVDLLALKYRSRAESLTAFTGLHIFVVTLRCDHSCHYCQVSRQTEDRTSF